MQDGVTENEFVLVSYHDFMVKHIRNNSENNEILVF